MQSVFFGMVYEAVRGGENGKRVLVFRLRRCRGFTK